MPNIPQIPKEDKMITLTVLFFTPQIREFIKFPVTEILVWISVAITVISGVEYLLKNKDVLKTK